MPVGIKDIFDTLDMPTENGSVLHAGRQPMLDAHAVAVLRAAGAVVMGKTVSTEFAVYSPGKTRNPCNEAHTPGGSSSGSAAAVGCSMVPLALGSQTNGSVIRPASYCGVYGYKPTHGRISRHGVLKLSRTLDHVGGFARSVGDLALLMEALIGFDGRDPGYPSQRRAALSRSAEARRPATTAAGLRAHPRWDQTEPHCREAFAGCASRWATISTKSPWENRSTRRSDWHRTIMETDLARNLAREYEQGGAQLSDTLRAMIERGQTHLALDYIRALDGIRPLNEALDQVFSEFDAILTPSASGEAPATLEHTGSPVFCTLWTLCGVPTVSAPLLRGPSGMPIGVQLVGARANDARLLHTAQWLAERLGVES